MEFHPSGNSRGWRRPPTVRYRRLWDAALRSTVAAVRVRACRPHSVGRCARVRREAAVPFAAQCRTRGPASRWSTSPGRTGHSAIGHSALRLAPVEHRRSCTVGAVRCDVLEDDDRGRLLTRASPIGTSRMRGRPASACSRTRGSRRSRQGGWVWGGASRTPSRMLDRDASWTSSRLPRSRM